MSPRDFKLFHDPTYGNCYTFNWDRSAQVTAHRAGANYGKTLPLDGGPREQDIRSGLRVLVYANVSEYLPITEAVGFRITVHDKWTVPFVDAFGYNAPTGTLSAFGVRMVNVYFFRILNPRIRLITLEHNVCYFRKSFSASSTRTGTAERVANERIGTSTKTTTIPSKVAIGVAHNAR